jgi:hypothetical protein
MAIVIGLATREEYEQLVASGIEDVTLTATPTGESAVVVELEGVRVTELLFEFMKHKSE